MPWQLNARNRDPLLMRPEVVARNVLIEDVRIACNGAVVTVATQTRQKSGRRMRATLFPKRISPTLVCQAIR